MSSSTAVSSSAPSKNDAEVLQKYQFLKNELAQIATKIGDLELERDEHALVMDTLKKLEGDRKCYRLIGGVLTQNNIENVLPTVEKNHDGITKLITTLATSYKTKEASLAEFQKENNIRIKTN